MIQVTYSSWDKAKDKYCLCFEAELPPRSPISTRNDKPTIQMTNSRVSSLSTPYPTRLLLPISYFFIHQASFCRGLCAHRSLPETVPPHLHCAGLYLTTLVMLPQTGLPGPERPTLMLTPTSLHSPWAYPLPFPCSFFVVCLTTLTHPFVGSLDLAAEHSTLQTICTHRCGFNQSQTEKKLHLY